jgi:hypothetical protein
VVLVRQRGGGTDSLVLHRTAPARYTGKGTFYAPLRCAGRKYRRGERVPFKVVVRVTAAMTSNGIVVATALRATYANPARVNLTPCVAFPGHDAATYRGQLVGP